jgi:AraC-like DNA-binding protein
MRFPTASQQFFGFFPPYHTVEPLSHPSAFPTGPIPSRGAALLWNAREGEASSGARAVRSRPPGVSLIIILPPSREMDPNGTLLELMERCRPHSVLPFINEIDPEELIGVLRRFPPRFDLEVVDYLVWRGLKVDLDTRRLLRKAFELSDQLRTVSGLARALYMSRRALGRRFTTRGLPVPSHWLHFGRVLRASIRLQDPTSSLFGIGCELGYPDGFALSNQLKRLTGLRPSIMKECFGWDWIVESWLLKEAQAGNLSEPMVAVAAGSPSPTPGRTLRVSERRPVGKPRPQGKGGSR